MHYTGFKPVDRNLKLIVLVYVKTVITKGMQCSPPVGIARLNYMYTLATCIVVTSKHFACIIS